MVLGAWIHRRLASGSRAPSQRQNAIIYNSQGFAALPIELLHRIASHLPGATVTWYRTHDYDQRNERRKTLRALSQLSRSLRITFLPLCWQKLEVYTPLPPFSDGGAHITTQTEVERKLLWQLKLVRNVMQSYAPYIRCRLSPSCGGSAVHHS